MDLLNLQLASQIIPSGVLKLLWVLFLSFLIGLEREEHRTETGRYAFGGVRTYPLIGLVGYSLAFLSNGQGLPLAVGLFAIATLMALSY
ncbi:MAG: MgtC/SapB family protein, partial [Cyanobacteria bacterium P01_A01_bin.17]